MCVCVCVQRLATYIGDYQHQHFKRRTVAAIRYGGPTVVVALLRGLRQAEYHASQASDLDEIILSTLLAFQEMAVRVRGLTMTSFAEESLESPSKHKTRLRVQASTRLA